MKKDFIDYAKLFGNLDFKDGDKARSVYSPAAYLADLLQLIEDYFDIKDEKWIKSGFHKRRPDIIQDIDLDREQTYTLLPYLDIVNELLEKEVGSDPYTILKQSSYPLNLPFHLDFKKADFYLKQLEVSWEEILKSFSQRTSYGPEGTETDQRELGYLSREYMGWSDEDFSAFVTPNGDLATFLTSYGVKLLHSTTDESGLDDLEVFLSCTGINNLELREIIYQNLSLRKNKADKTEAAQASKFFINLGFNGAYAIINEETNQLEWVGGTSVVPFEWFEKVDRFIKIQKKSGISFSELDLILRQTPTGIPFQQALLFIPLVKNISERTGLKIEEISAFLTSISPLGIGDSKTPSDQFNRLLNSKSSPLYKKYISLDPNYQILQFDGYSILNVVDNSSPTKVLLVEDILLPSSEDSRNHIIHAFGIKEKDFELIVKQLRKKVNLEAGQTSFFSKGVDLHSLTVLFRIHRLAQICELSVSELFELFDIIASDPSIRNHNFFDIFISPAAKTGDKYYQFKSAYKTIFSNDAYENVWLLQTVFALSKWMSENELNTTELKFWITGKEKDDKTTEKVKKDKLRFLNNLLKEYKPSFLQEAHFQSNRFSARGATLILETVQNLDYGLVSEQDNRLVLIDQPNAKQAAYDSIIDLEMINIADFKKLQISEKMVNKIINNLVLLGYLDKDNNIIEKNFPEDPADFSIDFDFSELNELVFEIFHKIVLEALVELNEQDIDFDLDSLSTMDVSVFKSDLETLGLTTPALEALYSNLIFNQHIDEKGAILAPYSFAFEEEKLEFELNVNLESYAEQIHAQLAESMSEFLDEELIISEDIFQGIGLEGFEIKDLMENLVFNDYLSDKHNVLDKNVILKLTDDKFLLALIFYPKRKAILKALQDRVRLFKNNHFALDANIIFKVADEIVAQRIFEALSPEYFPEGPVKVEHHHFFLDESNKPSFYIDPYFDGPSSDTVYDEISKIIYSSNRFLFNDLLLEELEFNAREMSELRGLLVEKGYITDYNALHQDQIPFFLNINNAINFKVEKFEDYNKDIFFALNNIAKEKNAGIAEITAQLRLIAEIQESNLFVLFQSEFGLDANLIELIFKKIYASDDNLGHQILIPIINSVLEKEDLIKEVSDVQFNLAYRRMRQLVSLFTKMELNTRAARVILDDQDIAEKFPEKLAMPLVNDAVAGLIPKSKFDALLETQNDTYLVFFGNQYAEYSTVDFSMKDDLQPLGELSSLLAGIAEVNAAYQDELGNEWILAGGKAFVRKVDADKWETQEKKWGLQDNNFSKPKNIDFSFVDDKGRTFIFSGNQYSRYSNDLDKMDEGYPKEIKGNWEKENIDKPIPAEILSTPGSTLLGPDGKRYIFKKDKYSSSDDFNQLEDVDTFWGKVKNNFSPLEKIDAMYFLQSKAVIINGNQLIEYSNSLENNDVWIDEGSPKSLESIRPDLLKELGGKISAAFTDENNNVHFFGKGKYLSLSGDYKNLIGSGNIADTWGKNNNNLASSGTVDAALDGLDGNIYLFSGAHYYRYSGADYTNVDAGYPRSIKEDWGALDRVDAGTILDGKTYLFGQKDGQPAYIRFSTNDYTKPDKDYGEKVENFWNLPFSLIESGFDTPDAIFQGFDGNTHLFLKDKFVTFDRLQRWWSEPADIKSKWAGIPSGKVDAAFIGKDGKTYLFIGDSFVRYTDKNYNKIDADFPKKSKDFFGKVKSRIASENKIDAAVSLISRVEDKDKKITETRHTYLFAGDQFFRYTGSDLKFIDTGYPKFIAQDLAKEPRFKELDINSDQAIDAVMADERNVYAAQGNEWSIYSDTLYKVYNHAALHAPQAVIQEDGANYLFSAGSWKWFGHIEHKAVLSKAATPQVVEKFPADYTNGLESILQGVDGNTYIFRNGYCYNVALEKSYPTQEAWGISSNNFLQKNEIDSGFLGLDGKIHLFSGNQFISYTIKDVAGVKTIPEVADGNPDSVAEKWGGLSHVFLAYVNEGKTYLMERPDAAGNFNYVCYSSKDYSKPDDGFPKQADFSYWKIPSDYINDGFDKVTAVHVEDDNFYLLNGNTFIQYNSTLDQWTPPMPAERVWPGLPIGDTNLNKATFEGLKSLLSGPNGELFFFSENGFVSNKSGQFSTILPIKDRWGKVHKEFIGESSRVDASIVTSSDQTFLFSGKNYIRYSTSDYNVVDPGYPKTIAKNLRLEEEFESLPESFDEMIKTKGKIDAILRNNGNVLFFMGEEILIMSYSQVGDGTTDFLGDFKNNILENNIVDAAYTNPKGDIILFSGDQYYRYSGDDLTYTDEGYPKLIKANFEKEEGIPVPKDFEKGIDNVTTNANGGVVLTKGDQFAQNGKGGNPTQTGSLTNMLGGVENVFGKNGDLGVDAAFLAPDGYFYVFKNQQYIRYENTDSEFIDSGYPKPIKDNWGNMPLNFEDKIDGAFVLDGRTYLAKGDQYIRYSDVNYNEIDSIYPQLFRDRWGHWGDIHLGDLNVTVQFKKLLKKSGSKSESLLDFFDPKAPDRSDSFELLGKIFDWLVDEIKWLKRKNGFLPATSRFERNMDLELVLRMDEIFSLSKRLNRRPTAIFEKLWNRLYANSLGNAPRIYSAVAEVLSEILSSTKNKSDWKELELKIHDHFNDLRRDAMLPYVIAKDSEVENARDLLGKLLIDVEMGVEAKTSRIKEGIAAAQLFLHRYFVQVEDFNTADGDEEIEKANLKEKWKWLKNYRVWEANRKVYLYPENYLRPELRDVRTDAFDTLSNELLQGEMDKDSISQIYKKYLDDYTEVSRLTIAGGFVYDNPENPVDKELILFGRTKTDPRRYYYRDATFFESDNSAIWHPWSDLKIKIDSDDVYPVYAFGRVFVFWAIKDTEVVNPEKGAVQVRKTGDDVQNAKSADQSTRAVVKIYFSFYNLNKEWASPQLLDTKIYEEGNVTIEDDIELSIQRSHEVGGAQYENISVKCGYTAKSYSWHFKFNKHRWWIEWKENFTRKYTGYKLTPELYTVDGDSSPFDNSGVDVFNTIFTNENISRDRVVKLNNTAGSIDDQWISFDHKGGSFLCRPDRDINKKINEPTENPGIGNWNKIDAAFHLSGKGNYLFSGREYTKPGSTKKLAVKSDWGNVGTGLSVKPQVNCSYEKDGIAYLFTDKEKYTYEVSDYGKSIKDRISLKGKAPSAAFYRPDTDELYKFFSDGNFSINDKKSFLRRIFTNTSIKDNFGNGKEKVLKGDKVNVFHYKNFEFLIIKGKYYKWKSGQYNKPEAGYPKAANLVNITTDLEVPQKGLEHIKVYEVFTRNDGSGLINSSGSNKPYKQSFVAIGSTKNKRKVSFHHAITQKTRWSFKWDDKNDLLFLKGGAVAINDESKAIKLPNGRAVNSILKDTGKKKYYVFSNDKYKSINIIPSEKAEEFTDRLKSISWSDAPMASDWGRRIVPGWAFKSTSTLKSIKSKVATDKIVDAAWFKAPYTYLTRGNEYIRYSTDNYDQFDEGYPKKISTNTEGLPKWTSIDSAFNGADGKIYFFNNKTNVWVNSDNVNKSGQVIGDWGKLNEAYDFNHATAAFCVPNGTGRQKIYLFKNNIMICHSVRGAQVNSFIDPEYPKTVDREITAACVLDKYVYLFSHNEYKRFPQNTDFLRADFVNGFKSTTNDLTNIHRSFLPKFDAALHDLKAEKIYLYKDQQMITFREDENDKAIKTNEEAKTKYIITRLTSGTGYKLNTILFAGQVDDFLNIRTQSTDETPAFNFDPNETSPGIIKVKPEMKDRVTLPVSSHLDFNSSNGIYYWEMFYHAPLLIAQTYNNLQNFEAAKEWYGFVFDPTQVGEYWKFMPFLAVDAGAIIDGLEASINQLEEIKGGKIAELKTALGIAKKPTGIMAKLKEIDEAVISDKLNVVVDYTVLENLTAVRTSIENLTATTKKSILEREKRELSELSFIIEKLESRMKMLNNTKAQISAYLRDPFDPHAIAVLRKIAYRKSVVMRYVDNLLDWGDMLFRQYTVESINEARMHYILAYDLLGHKPENVGRLLLPETKKYISLDNTDKERYDFILDTLPSANSAISEPYFYVPENDNFLDYWTRVEDRLYKIRQSLNILGIKQALPLFQPPIDPMALVNAAASGGGLASALAGGSVAIPHYRFTFMLDQAKQLADKVNQYGNDLLSNLEKKDSEELSLLQTRQEGEILDLTRKVNQAQIDEAELNLLSAEVSIEEADLRISNYSDLMDEGFLPQETAQIAMMVTSNILNTASMVLKIGSALAFAFPKVDVGPFKMGIQVGGDMVANGLDKISEAIQGVAAVTSLTGEILGVYAGQERMKEDWSLQLETAKINKKQFEYQRDAAKLQVSMAEYQMDILEKQIKHNQQVGDFYRDKYTNKQLYSWMVSQLSSIYYQTYKNAFDMAKSAEKAYQFERGIKPSEANFIGGGYWDSQKKGLLAGDKLNADIQKMEKSYYETDERSFEIRKDISLFTIDPVAVVNLKQNRVCEFSLTEALFNYDFQGHYRRQIKSITVSFEAGQEDLNAVNATLTQLTSKIVMEPDIKAVKYLTNLQGDMPESIRGNWRSSQQIALSRGFEDGGLFELRFEDERYLPFEGTGAVSDWRLELNGRREDYDIKEITDVIITVNYTADQGGDLFASEVKSTLKPYLSAQVINVANGYPQAWNDFQANEEDELSLKLDPSMFPNIRGNKIDGILCKYELLEPGSIGLMLKEQDGQELTDGKLMTTSGLKIPKDGGVWTFKLNGDKANLKNVELIFTYKAEIS